MTMRILFSLVLPLSVVVGQIQGPPIEEEQLMPSYSFGITGALNFVDAKRLNDGIHFINTTLDLNVPRVNSMLSASGFFRIWLSPKAYAVLKGEYIGFSRSFEYGAPVTTTSGSGTSSFLITNTRRYNIIPFGAGVGFSFPKSVFEGEIGFQYALGSIRESGSMEGYGSYSSDYDGHGIGVWVLVRPLIRLSNAVCLAPDLTGRLLVIKDFEDQRGRELRGFDINLSSASIGLSLIVTF